MARSSWPAEARHLASVRTQVHQWLAGIAFPPSTADNIVLAVNEAATNVIEHAYPVPGREDAVDVELCVEGPMLSITVVDHGRWQTPAVGTARGFGIPLMRQLLDLVLIQHDASGTRTQLRHAMPGFGPVDLPRWPGTGPAGNVEMPRADAPRLGGKTEPGGDRSLPPAR